VSETLSLAQFVAQQLQSGKYQSYEDMVQAGLRLLQEHEEELDRIAEALRPTMQDYLRGDRGVPVNMEDIKAAGRKQLTPG
jgi:putative addiction module CopG family antidote